MGSGRNKRFEDSLLGRLEIANGCLLYTSDAADE